MKKSEKRTSHQERGEKRQEEYLKKEQQRT